MFAPPVKLPKAKAISHTTLTPASKPPQHTPWESGVGISNQAMLRSSDTGRIEAPSIVQEVLGSPGQPLEAQARAYFEPRFGYEFSRVRVHVGDRASKSAATLGASA